MKVAVTETRVVQVLPNTIQQASLSQKTTSTISQIQRVPALQSIHLFSDSAKSSPKPQEHSGPMGGFLGSNGALASSLPDIKRKRLRNPQAQVTGSMGVPPMVSGLGNMSINYGGAFSALRTSNASNHFKPLMQNGNTKELLLNHLNQRFSIGNAETSAASGTAMIHQKVVASWVHS
jgi:hypothetical protein